MLRYYLSAIGIATAIVAVLNAIFASSLGFSPWLLILLTVAFVLFAFLVDGVIACLARILPKKLFEPDRKRFAVHTFLRETCYAEIMHEYSAPLAFLILFAAPGALKWTIALPVAVVNFILQTFPIAVQRYNRNRLTKIYRVRLKKAEKAAAGNVALTPAASAKRNVPGEDSSAE